MWYDVGNLQIIIGLAGALTTTFSNDFKAPHVCSLSLPVYAQAAALFSSVQLSSVLSMRSETPIRSLPCLSQIYVHSVALETVPSSNARLIDDGPFLDFQGFIKVPEFD